jgi:hypothetical protein
MRCLKRRISDAVHRQLVADAERARLLTATRAAGAGPGGHCGATQESSAVDLPPHIDTSDQPLPEPAHPTLSGIPARANPHPASAPRPPRRSRQDGAPHRTNDLDGDKRRRTLQGAETTPLTQRGTGMQRTRFACADADIIPYDERLTARASSRSMFESTTPHHRKRIPLRMLDAVLPDLLAHQPERRGPRGTVRSVDFRSRFADSSRRCRAHSHPAHFPGVVGRRIMPGACAVSHAWSPALVAAWGWSVVELVSDPGSGGDVMGD